jgi:hypothetical protein
MQTPSLVIPRSLLRLAALAASLALFSISASAQYPSIFTANLSGSQQSPPTSSPGTAFGRVTIDDPSPAFPSTGFDVQVRISIAYSGLQGKATRIQVYEQPLTPPDAEPILRFTISPASGTSGFIRNREFTIQAADNAQAQSLRAGNFYFLIRTTTNPQGEIRGWIRPDDPYVAALNGAQVSPPNSSIGTGVARISLSADETKIMVSLNYGFLTGGQTAFIGGLPGGEVKDLGTPDAGGSMSSFGEYYDKLFDITAAGVALLKQNNLYAHVTGNLADLNIRSRVQALDRGLRRSDFDGDGVTDVAVWRPSNGFWNSIRSTNGATHSYNWGTAGDKPVPADYDGDGQTDRAVFRKEWVLSVDPPNVLYNVWLIEPSSTIDSAAPGNNLRTDGFGLPGDVRLPYDYDGDGQADLAVYRLEEATWYIQQSATKTMRVQTLGQPNQCMPYPGDYDGDHKTDLAVLESGQTPTLKILRSSDGVLQSVPFSGNPVIRDYDGDGKVDLANVQLENNTLVWRITQSSNGTLLTTAFGQFGDMTAPADYDGDGKADLAVWRPANQTWYIQQSSDGLIRAQQLGAAGDVLVPAAIY